MIKWFISIAFLVLIRSGYSSCAIDMIDLTSQIRTVTRSSAINSIDLVDQYSKEPVRRYVQLLKDGSIIILEQKNCLMYNLSLTFLLPEDYSLEKAHTLVADVLEATDIWSKWFHTLDAGEIFDNEFSSERFLSSMKQSPQFSYSMDDKIRATDESSEVILSFAKFETDYTPYSRFISIYIGVGGI